MSWLLPEVPKARLFWGYMVCLEEEKTPMSISIASPFIPKKFQYIHSFLENNGDRRSFLYVISLAWRLWESFRVLELSSFIGRRSSIPLLFPTLRGSNHKILWEMYVLLLWGNWLMKALFRDLIQI